MKIFRILFLTTVGLIVFASNLNAAITTFTDETIFLGQVSSAVSENFDGPAWDTVRSTSSVVNAADSITSLGITWTSIDQVTTIEGAGRSGFGLFSYVHGTPDSIVGQTSNTLFAIGFWVVTNTPYAKVNLILDDTEVVDFNDVPIGTEFVYLGVISSTGFNKFEIREIEGTPGDPKLIFIDDVTVSGNAAVVNQPPVADAGTDRTVVEGEAVILDGSQSIDLDDGIKTYKWAQSSGTPIVVLSDASSAMPRFTAPQVDQQGAALVFTITVTDNGGLQDSDQVAVNVVDASPGNQPPVADAGIDQTVYEGEQITLDGSGSDDPDDGIDAFLWQQVAGALVVLSDPADPMPTFNAPTVNAIGDVLVFELTVKDKGNLVGTDRVSVFVNDVPDSPTGPTDGAASGGGGGCFVSVVVK